MRALLRLSLVRLMILVSLVPLQRAGAADDTDLGSWLEREALIAQGRMAMNISPTGSMPGVILASPSRFTPNYYYYWVRDGAMVMRSILEMSELASHSGIRDSLVTIRDYVLFSRDNQLKAGANLGEPRFNVDGSLNTEPWGRPQNDGPALRALLLTRFATDLLDHGDTPVGSVSGDARRAPAALALKGAAISPTDLYAPKLPAETVIKADLEYIAHHWREKCIDLWEELWGHHFFTRATELAALREGARLASRMGDPGASAYYAGEADALETELARHWSESRGYYLATLDADAGPDHQKPTDLDTSVILGALASEQDAGLLSLANDRILSTALALEDAFAALYPINKDMSLAPAIGRYPEDVYFGGNPWVLATAAFAELNYRLAAKIQAAASFPVSVGQSRYLNRAIRAFGATRLEVETGADLAANPRLKAVTLKALGEKGDSFLRRLRRHVNPDGSFSEQFRADNGFMISAYDLSWSYAAFLRAWSARRKLDF